MTVDLAKLAAPFPPDKVHWRVGPVTKDKSRGQALCYIDARDVMDRLDEVCGPEGWQSEILETARGRVLCRIGILFNEQTNPIWVWKSDGAGDTDIEGEKGGISDAFKRAAVHWGIGRYLYRIDGPWVALDPTGKKFLPSEHAKLQMTLPGSSVNGSAQKAPPPAKQPHEAPESGRTPEATHAAGQPNGEEGFFADIDREKWTPELVDKRGREIAAALRDHGQNAETLASTWDFYKPEIITMPPAAQKGLRRVYDTEFTKV